MPINKEAPAPKDIKKVDAKTKHGRKSTLAAMAKKLYNDKGDSRHLSELNTSMARKNLSKEVIASLQKKKSHMNTDYEDVWDNDIEEGRTKMKKKFRDFDGTTIDRSIKPRTCSQRLKCPKRFMISYKSVKKKTWDMFVLILVVYNGFQVPYQNAFHPEFFDELPFQVLDLLIDIVFVIDIFLMFITSVISNKGKETFDQSIIAKQYTGRIRFYADLLSLLGAGIF